jgi:hypothetical protein
MREITEGSHDREDFIPGEGNSSYRCMKSSRKKKSSRKLQQWLPVKLHITDVMTVAPSAASRGMSLDVGKVAKDSPPIDHEGSLILIG